MEDDYEGSKLAARWDGFWERHRAFLSGIEHIWESMFFRTRWVLIAAYAILIACLFLLVVKTAQSFWKVATEFLAYSETETIVKVLSIVDIVLVINLLLMIIFVGYTNFVSRIEDSNKRLRDKPGWMETLGYSGLKVQLLGSILAISSVKPQLLDRTRPGRGDRQ